VDFSFLACFIGLVNCMGNRVRMNAKMHHFKPKSPQTPSLGAFGASIRAPASLDLGAFGASCPPKRNVWIRPCMPMTIHRSKWKPDIEFQYGGRPFSENGSSYISAVDRVISSKFGVRIDFRILKQIPSLNVNPEVHFRLYGRHLEKSI